MYWTALQTPAWDEEYALLLRLLALRRAGKVGVILAECGVYYISDGPVTDVWGYRVRYSKKELLELVESLEKKSPGRVCLSLAEGSTKRRDA